MNAIAICLFSTFGALVCVIFIARSVSRWIRRHELEELIEAASHHGDLVELRRLRVAWKDEFGK